MSDQELTRGQKVERGIETLLLSSALIGIALIATTWFLAQPAIRGKDSDENPVSFYFVVLIGTFYAFTGAVVRALAHGRSPLADYLGKQLGVAGAAVAAIGALRKLPELDNLSLYGPLAAGAVVLIVIVVALMGTASWLNHVPEDTRAKLKKKATRKKPTLPGRFLSRAG